MPRRKKKRKAELTTKTVRVRPFRRTIREQNVPVRGFTKKIKVRKKKR